SMRQNACSQQPGTEKRFATFIQNRDFACTRGCLWECESKDFLGTPNGQNELTILSDQLRHSCGALVTLLSSLQDMQKSDACRIGLAPYIQAVLFTILLLFRQLDVFSDRVLWQ